MIGLKPLIHVDCRHHILNLAQGEHEHSGDEEVDDVDAHAPEKVPRHRAHREPRNSERYKSRIGEPLYRLCAPLILTIFLVIAATIYIFASRILLEELDCNRHSQTCHQNLHRKQIVMDNESQIGDSCNQVLYSILPSYVFIFIDIIVVYVDERVIRCQAQPKNVQTDHLDGNERGDLLTRAPLVNVDGM